MGEVKLLAEFVGTEILSFVANYHQMKKQFFFTFAILLTTVLFAQPTQTKLKTDILFLTHDSLQGREMGTRGEEMAAKYVAERMMEIALEAKGTGKEGEVSQFMQAFSVTPKANPHATEAATNTKAIHGSNVLGFIDNQAENTIVIGAHFDHLGTGTEGSLHAAKDGQIHNGADDNASGVALMLHLAEALKSNTNLTANNYLFMAFSGEEKGLWGSNYFCKNPTIDLNKVSYMINFDMVGRLQTEKGLAISGVGTSPIWEKSLEAANKNGLKLILSESGVGPSDHTSFYLQDIPVLHFFTGQHSDYHKPSDDEEKINYEGIATISGLVQALIKEVNAPEKLVFTKTKDEQDDTPRFTVTLGVMPDYLFQGDGMRIDGVTDGRPASKAGFEKGDIVIKMGETKVEGMQSYMKALSKFKKGDKTKVTILRGEKKITEKVTF